MRVFALVFMAGLFVMCANAAADSIVLKTAARLAPGATSIVLRDIAVLEGEEAIGLAEVAIASVQRDSGPMEVSVAAVREALDAAGVNWARVNLSGRNVLLRPARDPHAAAPLAMSAVTLEQADRRAPREPSSASINAQAAQAMAFDAVIGEQTIRSVIASLITTNLRTDARDLRAGVDADDLDLLATALNTARFEVQPLGAFTGDRMEFAVRRWDGATSRVLGQVTLMLERRATVTRLRQDVPRDRVLTVDDLETSEAWLSASEALNVAPRDAIVGRSLTRSLKAGDVIRTRDLQQEVLVKRGDVVTVRCLVGGVAISLQAEARADGAQGDAVEFRKTGERENFVATITGRNQAMVDLSRR